MSQQRSQEVTRVDLTQPGYAQPQPGAYYPPVQGMPVFMPPNPQVMIEPPSDMWYALLACGFCCHFNIFGAIPLFLSWSARSEVLSFSRAGDIHSARRYNKKAYKMMKISIAVAAAIPVLVALVFIILLSIGLAQGGIGDSTRDVIIIVVRIVVPCIALICLCICCCGVVAEEKKR